MNEMNSTGITREDFAVLVAPFASKDHEFNRGFIYIEETAVCRRIEQVDLSWEWKTLDMPPAENGIVTVVGALTIKGITRFGTGQQVIHLDKNGAETVGEARKGATTDALKRAARLFGIGRYLLDCPKTVKDYGSELDKWLKEVAKGQGLAPQMATAPQQAAPAAVMPTASPAPKSAAPAWWPVLSEYKPFMEADDFNRMRDELSAAAKQGTLILSSDIEARIHIEKTHGLFIDLDALRAAVKEAS